MSNNILNSLTLTLKDHPSKTWDIDVQIAYSTLFKEYANKLDLTGEQIKSRYNLFMHLYKDCIDEKVSFSEAKKKIRKNIFITLKDDKKIKCFYPKYLLFIDLVWLYQGILPEHITAAYIKDTKLSQSDCKKLQTFADLLLNSQIDQIATLQQETLKSRKFGSLEYYINQIKDHQHHSQLLEKHIPVVATMSSGKSTFLNAICDTDIFPTKNTACTAKSTSYKHNRYLDHIIGCARKKDGEYLYEGVVTKETLIEWNDDPSIESIHLEGNIDWIDSDSPVNAVFYDTPGTNYSQDASHQQITIDFLKSSHPDLILYLINATQIATEDDKWLLKSVQSITSKQNTKFLFLLNQVDKFDLEANDDLTTSLNQLKTYIQSCQVNQFEIIPISAYAAKLFRWANRDIPLGRKEQRDLTDMLEIFSEEAYNLPQYCSFMAHDDTSQDKSYIRTNLPLVTQYIQSSLNT